jgi:hypothetical protein
MPQRDPGIMAPGLVPVIAVTGDGPQRDDQVGLPGYPGGQPPGSVAARRPRLAGRGEREPLAGGHGPAGRVMATRRASFLAVGS